MTPTEVQVLSVASTSAVVGWLPADSALEHRVTVDDAARVVIRPGGYRCTITGKPTYKPFSFCILLCAVVFRVTPACAEFTAAGPQAHLPLSFSHSLRSLSLTLLCVDLCGFQKKRKVVQRRVFGVIGS